MPDARAAAVETRTLADPYGASEEPTREEVRTYFGPGGEGASVRSLAAIRIDSGTEPVGVLNIDTDVEDVLGTSPEYYPTFVALLRPLLWLLEPLVKAYAAAWWAKIDDETPMAPGTAPGTAPAADA